VRKRKGGIQLIRSSHFTWERKEGGTASEEEEKGYNPGEG